MPSSRGFPDTEIKPGSPALQVDSLLFEPPGGKGPRNSSWLNLGSQGGVLHLSPAVSRGPVP